MLEYDPNTKKWIQYNPNKGAIMTRCKICNQVYNEGIGHDCRKNANKTVLDRWAKIRGKQIT